MELLAAIESSTTGNQGAQKIYKKRAVCFAVFILVVIMLLELALNFFSKMNTSTLDTLLNFLTNKTSSECHTKVAVL